VTDYYTSLNGETPDERRKRLQRERAARYRARKRGESVPVKAYPRGYKQDPEHAAKRRRHGAEHHSWKGDGIAERSGRTRARRAYPQVGPCARCGSDTAERHHIDDDTRNNSPENIAILCRRCHMLADGRLEWLKQFAGHGVHSYRSRRAT
jgi:hypothetical protein